MLLKWVTLDNVTKNRTIPLLASVLIPSALSIALSFFHSDCYIGVAFEQGKTLPTPETVPFRLTRDVVDGMGVAGVEGVFRRCCEITMEVMRASQEELRTIVEVCS